ncbi:MAG: MFS transporter [Chloroflexi bacterium]|nr:MFS transporter [Chloroflexota bacterium]
MNDMLQNHRRIVIYLIASNFLMYFGFQVWQTMFNNYAVETVGVGPASIGLIQALREVPGLLGLLIGVLALYLSEIRIMAASVILLGVGMIFTGQANSVPALLIATVVMSLGFHFFMPSSNSVVLMAVKTGETPKTLGQLGSLSSIASVVGTAGVFLLASRLGYRTLFIGVGVLAVIGGLLLIPLGNVGDGLPPGRKLILRRRYWLYYTLSFLLGSRRHIFTTFAIFLLVRVYGISIQTTALLYLVNSVINIFTLRLAGQLVGRLGERVALSIAFASLAFIFLGYAFIAYLPVLFLLFVLDNVLFGFNLALTTYFQKIAATPEEITSNLSAEQAINHIAAILIPILGGAAWELFGPRAPFLVGVVIVLIALALTQLIRTPAAPATERLSF